LSVGADVLDRIMISGDLAAFAQEGVALELSCDVTLKTA
jgi:hypothetical protein